MKTLLGVVIKNHGFIHYLKLVNGELIAEGPRTSNNLDNITKIRRPLYCDFWGIFPSHLKRLLAENGVNNSTFPSTDIEFLETSSAHAIYCAGERLAIELGINSPAICWQDALKDLPDSEAKNLVWLASEKFLQHMNFRPVKL